MLFECDTCLQIAVWGFCAQTVDSPAHYKLHTCSLRVKRKRKKKKEICCQHLLQVWWDGVSPPCADLYYQVLKLP